MTGKITARQFWIKEPGRGEIREGRLDPPGRGSVLVRALYSGISRGTESLVFRGEVPESQQEAMRCPFQQGDFPAPVKYGYMSVGVVEVDPGAPAAGAAGAVGDSGGSLEGRTVFCLHPHQDRYVVPRDAVVALPDGLPPERAVLAANLETAVNAAWDASPAVGDRVVVVGGGVVGMLVAWLVSRIPGVSLTLVDPLPSRGGPARSLGIEHMETRPASSDADLVVHASGHPDGLRSALELAGEEATVVELSWFGSRPVSLPLGESFHSRRLTLRSSQVGRIPPGRAARWDHRRRMELALELLGDPALDILVSGESPFEDLPALMERLADDGDTTLCHRIRYP